MYLDVGGGESLCYPLSGSIISCIHYSLLIIELNRFLVVQNWKGAGFHPFLKQFSCLQFCNAYVITSNLQKLYVSSNQTLFLQMDT